MIDAEIPKQVDISRSHRKTSVSIVATTIAKITNFFITHYVAYQLQLGL